MARSPTTSRDETAAKRQPKTPCNTVLQGLLGGGLEVGEPAFLVLRPLPVGETAVRLRRIGRLLLHAGAALHSDLRDWIDHALAAPATRADGQDYGRRVSRADDDVLRPGRTVEEVPCLQLPLFTLDDQEALAGQHEEVLLRVLAVIEAHRLPRRQDVQVDPQPREAALALEVAERPERRGVAPAAVLRAHHEPALAPGTEAELRGVERRLGHQHP